MKLEEAEKQKPQDFLANQDRYSTMGIGIDINSFIRLCIEHGSKTIVAQLEPLTEKMMGDRITMVTGGNKGFQRLNLGRYV